MSLRFSSFRYSWYLPLLIVIVLAGSVFASLFIYRTIDRSERDSLLNRAETIAATMDSEEVTVLAGDETDLTNPAYINLKSKLYKIRDANPDSRFIYVNGKRNEEIFFYADSEDPESEDYSAPGDIYSDYSPAISGALEGVSGTEGPLRDVYGNWVTGVAPLRDGSGNVVGSIGIDVNASLYQRNVYTYASIPLVTGFILIIFIYVAHRIRRVQADSIELKTKFIAIASHELRTPLTGLVWASSALAHDPSVTPQHRDTIKEVSVVSKNLLESVNTILDTALFDSKAKPIFSPVALDEIVTAAAKDLDMAAKDKNISINIIPASDPVLVKGNKSKLLRAISNILSNAIKYSPKGAAIEVSFISADKEVGVIFTDHGMGIPKSEQSKILKGFYRATNVAESKISGTGLGMYMVQNIVKVHGGTLSIDSEEGKGTKVTIAFPKILN